MNDLEKAARMALKTLEYIDLQDHDRDFLNYKECHDLDEAITALHQALSNSVEQPAQRWAVFCAGCRKEWSVPYVHPGKSICEVCESTLHQAVAADQAMTIAMMKAERRPWVGLTWDELPDSSCGDPAFLAGAQWANSKLKEKNA